MSSFYPQIKLEKRIVKEHYLYLANLPCPPQLKEALGYSGDAEIVGIWHDNHKVTVSDGYQTFTTTNPGWDKYCNHPEIIG